MQHIILIHGLFHHPVVLNVLAARLKKHTPHVSTFGYSTRHYNSNVLLELNKIVSHLPKDDTILFIGHSMGGLVIRQYLHAYPRHHVAVLTLGTPHQGSRLATWLYQYSIPSKILGTSQCAGLIAQYTPPYDGSYPLVSLAGRTVRGILSHVSLTPSNFHDGTVYEDETLLPGAEHHIVNKVSHTGLLFDKKVAEIVKKWVMQY